MVAGLKDYPNDDQNFEAENSGPENASRISTSVSRFSLCREQSFPFWLKKDKLVYYSASETNEQVTI